MKFPEIPTDNLYKFMAISGIVLIISSYLPVYLASKKVGVLERIKGESKLIDQEHDWVTKDLEILGHQIDTLMTQVVELTGISASEITMALNAGYSFNEISKDKNANLEKYQMKWEELEAKYQEQIKLQREQIIKLIQIDTNLNVHNRYLKMLLWWKKLTLITFSVGCFLSGFGFVRWYIKLQVPTRPDNQTEGEGRAKTIGQIGTAQQHQKRCT
jgi:hypothetical protein